MLNKRAFLAAMAVVVVSVPLAAGCGAKSTKRFVPLVNNAQQHVVTPAGTVESDVLPGTAVVGGIEGRDDGYHITWTASDSAKTDFNIYECNQLTQGCMQIISVTCGLDNNCSAHYVLGDKEIIEGAIVSRFDLDGKAVGSGLLAFDIRDQRGVWLVDDLQYAVRAIPAVAK